jgi:hypothetical protein
MGAANQTNVFESAFNEDERTELKAEDSEAWNGVTALLIFIVSMGVMIGFTGVMMAYFLT